MNNIFLSLVIVTRNNVNNINNILINSSNLAFTIATDHEIILVDNASTDNTIAILNNLTGEQGIPNVQVFALSKEVGLDIASWVGIENALGDFIVVINPAIDDIHFLPQMLDMAVNGSDVVFAKNIERQSQTFSYAFSQNIFNKLFKFFNGVLLTEEAPKFRLLSRKVANFILRHPHPASAYYHLPVTSGFSRTNLQYSYKSEFKIKKNIADSIDRGIGLLVSTTRGPMRLVSTLSLFGAITNMLYSVYVVSIGFLKADVAPGWVSLSLQQSGMFFLLSLVLWVLGEYILNMARLSNEGPIYYVAQEFTSARMTSRERLNIEQAQSHN